MQTELKNVMASHLKASEAVIRNHAELELLRLHGTSGESISYCFVFDFFNGDR